MNIPLEIPDADIVVCVRIPGEPQAWLRAGRSGGRTFNPKENTDAKKYVQWVIKQKHPQFPDAMDCANRFGLAAIFETQCWDTDGDNYLKQLLDSLQKFVVKNDRQFDDYFVHVERGAEKPNQQIIVYRTRCSLGGKQL
jgi:Holliday junction resolvase RusA-like endonuclease